MTPDVAPFRPRRSEAKAEELPAPSGNTFERLLAAKAVARLRRATPADAAAWLWPDDRVLQRAASSPAQTGVAGWASDLAHKVVKDALAALGPASAGAQLLSDSLVLTWDGNGLISAPGFVAAAANAGFVAEGAPIPVKQVASAAVTLQPYKLAAIGVLSREMIDSSNAQSLVGDVLTRAAGAAMDAALLGSAAASAAQPAGLLAGVSALTASTNTDLMEAFYQDVRALVDSVSAVAGNGPFYLVGSPGLVATMIMRFILQAAGILDAANVKVLGSGAVSTALICVAPKTVVCAISPDPVIETADAGELHMEDTSPLPVGSASPSRSLFQTNTVALKMRWPVTWVLRDPRGVAWLTPTWR